MIDWNIDWIAGYENHMGITPELARGAVRVSLGAANTAEQVSDFLGTLQITVSKLLRLTAVAV